MQWWDYLHELNMFSILFRMTLALLFGGMVGFDRSSKRRAAGLRTYMLVCMGATLVSITNVYIASIYGSDPTRLGAQVISGIGFLGAGTIIVTSNNQVKGLTTAAGLWASACVGLTIGVGFYEGAIAASVLIFTIITGLHRFDARVISRSPYIQLYVEFNEGSKLSGLLNEVRSKGIQVIN